MNTTVHANPEKLRDLEETLRRQLGEIERVVDTLRRSAADLRHADAWNDAQQEKFERALEEQLKKIESSSESIEQELVPYLKEQIETLEEFLRRLR